MPGYQIQFQTQKHNMTQNEFVGYLPCFSKVFLIVFGFSLIKEKQHFLYSLPIYWSTGDQVNYPDTIFVIVQGVPGKRKILDGYWLP